MSESKANQSGGDPAALPARRPRLTLFDLDHTLVPLDTNQAWVAFLIERGLLDAATFREGARRMEARYRAATSGVDVEFCEFFLGTLVAMEPADLETLLAHFVAERIEPAISPGARALVERHRAADDRVAIITATNRLISAPVARCFGIAHLIATEPERRAGRLTGKVAGVPAMREGKVERLDQWLREGNVAGATERGHLGTLRFYSDSVNDLPLLSLATEPCAVDPEPALLAIARTRRWPCLWLYREAPPDP